MRFALLVCEAWWGLVAFELASRQGFKLVHAWVHRCPVERREPDADTVPLVCRAVEDACVWYVKRAYCLQRSAVATRMLRQRGVSAELVIGYRPVPIDSHAWVEVDGQVVNDRQQYRTRYQVLDRL